jgi:hypothetical protein
MAKNNRMAKPPLCERDSSGTTVAAKCEAQAAKVMERIARREERSDEAARPKFFYKKNDFFFS